jgi:hypothetical protein
VPGKEVTIGKIFGYGSEGGFLKFWISKASKLAQKNFSKKIRSVKLLGL